MTHHFSPLTVKAILCTERVQEDRSNVSNNYVSLVLLLPNQMQFT